jgi:hypothetical protein
LQGRGKHLFTLWVVPPRGWWWIDKSQPDRLPWLWAHSAITICEVLDIVKLLAGSPGILMVNG